MKKWMLVSTMIVLAVTLAACGGAQSSTATATASAALSEEDQLLVGTLKLESTSQAVSAAQAKELLPLWETLGSLASSGTAAQQEVDAVVSQIKGTMSTEQISSITAMNLTQQDLTAAVVDTGASSVTSSTASSTSASSNQSQLGAPGGENPPTDMGSGIPADMGMQSAGQSQTGTAQTVSSSSSGSTSQVSPALINALVELLQKKVA
jgi:hypothetical protein